VESGHFFDSDSQQVTDEGIVAFFIITNADLVDRWGRANSIAPLSRLQSHCLFARKVDKYASRIRA
jgi:hypothetical protein